MAANLHPSSPGDSPEALRQTIRDHGTWPEERAVKRLLHSLELTGGARHRAVTVAVGLVEGARARRAERPFLDAFLQEFGLVESGRHRAHVHCGSAAAHSRRRHGGSADCRKTSVRRLVLSRRPLRIAVRINASTWGLMLTGGILELDPSIKTGCRRMDAKLTRKAGEPLVRLAVRRAMRIHRR